MPLDPQVQREEIRRLSESLGLAQSEARLAKAQGMDMQTKLDACRLRYAKARTWLAMTRGCSEDEVDRQIGKMLEA